MVQISYLILGTVMHGINKYLFILFLLVVCYSNVYSQNEPLNDFTDQEIETDSNKFNESIIEYGLGVSLSYPAGFNANFDYVNNNLVTGFAVGFYDDYLIGLEANIRYRIKIIGRVFLEPQIVSGFQYYDLDDVKFKSYIGIAAGINIYGLFIGYGRVNQSKATYYILSKAEYIKLGYIYYF